MSHENYKPRLSATKRKYSKIFQNEIFLACNNLQEGGHDLDGVCVHINQFQRNDVTAIENIHVGGGGIGWVLY